MYKRTTVICNKTGLHMRPASEFVNCASRFHSEITIRRCDSEDLVNAKSIVMLMQQAFAKGTRVEVTATGTDEVQTVDTLVELIDSGFGE